MKESRYMSYILCYKVFHVDGVSPCKEALRAKNDSEAREKFTEWKNNHPSGRQVVYENVELFRKTTEIKKIA